MPLLLILLKVTLLLVAALLLTVVMQRASAGSRHLVWLVALGALLALPVLATWGPLQWRVLPESLAGRAAVPTERSIAGGPTQPAPVSVTPVLPISAPSSSAPSGSGSTRSTSSRVITFVRDHAVATIAAAWLLVAMSLLTWLAYGVLSVRRIVGRAALLEHPDWQGPLYEIADRLGLDEAPRLLRSEDVKMPFAAGLMHCTIVLPAECDSWSADRRSAVLIHELGHVRRRDLVGHTLGRLACAIYWFHPMVWTAARRLRAESERACDDLALRFGARPSDYAEHLLDIVTCVRDHSTPSIALAMAHRKEFEGRMLAILNPELRRTSFGRLQTMSLVGVLSLLVVVISAAAPVQQQVVGAPAPAPAPAPAATPAAALSPRDPAPPAPPASRQVETNYRIETKTYSAIAKAYSQMPYALGKTLDDDTTNRSALLIQLLHTDTAAEVRRIAAWGLNRYDASATVRKALAVALAGDADARVREMAAWAIGNSDDGDVAVLAKAALSDKSDAVREVATWGLGNRAREGGADAVAQVLANDRDERVRSTAAWAVGQFGGKHAPRALVAALTDSNEEVRYKAAWAAGEIGDSTALPSLRAALRRETSARVQRAELRALLHAGEDPGKMVEWLKSPYEEVRRMAVRALAGGGGTDPWPWPWPRPIPQP